MISTKDINMKCCVCQKVYTEDDVFELQEFLHIAFIGGYGSVFGDMSRVEGSVCQHCLKDKLGEYLLVGDDWMGHIARQSGDEPTNKDANVHDLNALKAIRADMKELGKELFGMR